MSMIAQLLYWVTTGLLIPVVALLLIFLLRALALVGSSVATGLERRRYGGRIDAVLRQRSPAQADFDGLSLPRSAPLAAAITELSALGDAPEHSRRILSDLEIHHDRSVSAARILSRTGPMLGLMGTLIPLGPALLGLAEGDLTSLAENMLVAFATTVVGLLIGAIGFSVQQSRQRWAAQDMARAEFIASVAARERN
ncbi:MotA/TolQ/ExbB proton channel family protein [Glycocaulis profundi]|nr:MotA/TolQ/ExbB proton channel family protein [Glycocaulis profundi]